MPFKSDAQRAFFNANRKKLESQGVDVDEWNASSRGKKLPARVAKAASAPPYPSAVSAAGAGASAGQLTGHLTGKQASFLAISKPVNLSPLEMLSKSEQPKKVANYTEVPGMISTVAQLAKAAAEKVAFSSGLGMLPKPPASTALRYGVTRPTAGPGGSGGIGGIIGGMLPKPTMPYAAGGPGGMAASGAGAMPKPAGGGGGFGGMLPKPTMPYAAGGPGGMASAGAGAVQPKPMAPQPQPQLTLQQAGQEVNQARQNTVQNKTHGQNPATAMQMAPQPQLTLQQAGQEVNQARQNTVQNKTHGQNPATAMQMAPQPQPKPMAPQPQPQLTLQQAGQQVNQARQSTVQNKTLGQNPATAMQMAPQHTNPSDQAHAMLADLNKRRRAAGGEVSDAAAVQARANELLSKSNTMRNAPGYQPPGAGNSPRDQADAIRQKLNAMRRAAGGEVPEAAGMMREMNRLSAEYDRSALPNAAAARALGKAAAEKVALAGLAGGSLGALAGLLTSEKGQRNRAVGRGAAIGAGTEIGMYPGALAGALAGGGLGMMSGNPSAALGGLVAGGGLGAVGGGALGNMAARGLVGPYKNEKLDSGEDDDDDESEEKEAACDKKTRYQKMRERRGDVANVAVEAAMAARNEKAAFSIAGLFSSKPETPKPAPTKPATPAPAKNSLKATGKDLGVYSTRKAAGFFESANKTLEDAAHAGQRELSHFASGIAGNFAGKHLARHVVPGAIGGAAVGGLSGLLDPGQDPETGKKKSRIDAILRRALGGLATGGLAGGAFGQHAPGLSAHLVSQGGALGRRLSESASDATYDQR